MVSPPADGSVAEPVCEFDIVTLDLLSFCNAILFRSTGRGFSRRLDPDPQPQLERILYKYVYSVDSTDRHTYY